MLQSILHSIQAWFQKRIQPLLGWSPVEPSKAAPSEEILFQLPNELRQELLKQLQALPSNPTHLDQLTEDFALFFDSWEQRYCATETSPSWNIEGCGNVWIIVGASISDSPMIIADFIQDLADSSYQYKKLPIQSFQYGSRPENDKLRQCLQKQFGNRLPSPDSDRAIAVIPCLENCFLRSMNGLEAIDYLRDSLLTDTSIFWIIGVGQVGWQYLQAISALESYSDHVTHLEKLSGDQLSQWFEAVTNEIDIGFQSSALRSESSENDLNWRTQYFKFLSKESKGVDSVAVQLFLETLQIREEIDKEKENEESSEDDQPPILQAKLPINPSLPSLGGEDVYFLYSLLLHRTLTELQLAQSVGLSLLDVKDKIQALRKLRLVEQQDNLLRLNPAYYPAVYSRLDGDNFLV